MIKVNMMCGKRNFGQDWVHVDGALYDHVWSTDIRLFNLPPQMVGLIYCSHGIAYFSEEDFNGLLKAWYYALTPGGTLRIATPDFDRLSELYHCGVEFEKIKGPLYGKMQMRHETIYHKTSYDFKTLSKLLADAGFTNVVRYDHTKTEHPNTGNFSDEFDDHSASYINQTLISLNIQCIKPL